MVVPGSVMSLGMYVFTGCNALERVFIPRHFQTENLSLSCPEGTEIVYYDASTLRTPVPVPYSWLDAYPALLKKNGNDYEETASAAAANGVNRVWECYLAGLDPTNPESRFQVTIEMNEGTPEIRYSPNLGTARRYRIEGKSALSETEWKEKDSESRFFRVIVLPPYAATYLDFVHDFGSLI